MKRFLSMILALLLVVPFPAYAGATPSDADFPSYFSIEGNYPIVNYNSIYSTVTWSGVVPQLLYYDTSGKLHYSLSSVKKVVDSSGCRITVSKPTDFDSLLGIRLMINTPSQPNAGLYSLSIGYSSNVITHFKLRPPAYAAAGISSPNSSDSYYPYHNLKNPVLSDSIILPNGVKVDSFSSLNQSYQVSSSGVYTWSCGPIKIYRTGPMLIDLYLDDNQSFPFGGYIRINFRPFSNAYDPNLLIDANGEINNVTPANPSLGNIENAVNQIPDKVGDVADAVQDVVQGITNLPQNIAGALEPHYDNILQQLHHITEQLHALWDQLAAYFNDKLIPQMITDTNRIVEAIEAINLEVNVDFDALKQQLAQQHKEQMDNDNKNTEEIVNGYENGDMDFINGEFGTAAQNSDNAEDQLFNEVSGNISDFTFDLDMLSQYQTSLGVIGTILGHFVALPFVKTPMVFMLTLSIALIMIGYYRFKGGG